MPAQPFRKSALVRPLLLLGGLALTIFFGIYLIDWALLGRTGNPFVELFRFDVDTMQNALGNMAQVVAAVLGIVITVVSIVVQLAATRYTPRIADMFFRDRTNVGVMSFFVVACINAVWVSVSVGKDVLPRVSIIFTMLLVTFSLLLMVPYFAYVFDFLDPDRVVGRIQEQAVAAAAPHGEIARGQAGPRQLRAINGIEQLSDIAINAVGQKDKAIASGTIEAMRALGVSYLEKKSSISDAWFFIGHEVRTNPDFVSLAVESLDDLESRRVWVEWKVLRQYQAIYNEALGEMQDINHLIAIDTRYIGEAALAAGDSEAVALAVKFFNTYMRSTLNKQQVRTAYNVLNQYRQLAEHALAKGHGSLVIEVAQHLRYYGQIAHGMELAFVTETAAYDLATLCERAFASASSPESGGKGHDVHDALLRTLLELDREAESKSQETMLRGVRKAQAKLASYYLVAGAEAPARLIFSDMRDERPERLRSIRDELLRVESKDFWEVIDRGTNFDYVDAARKVQLRHFFTWFPALAAEPPTSQGAPS
ncbi:MAG: DUF2254 family protein [Polyangia bacterium]